MTKSSPQGWKKIINFLHQTVITSICLRAKISACEWINLRMHCASRREAHTSFTRLLTHECRNYKTSLATIISISKPSNGTILRWHPSISVSSVVQTHLRPQAAGWLACETLVLTPVFSFLPSARPNSKTFNFHVLKKRYHAPLRYSRSSFISANTTFKLVKNHARRNKKNVKYMDPKFIST